MERITFLHGYHTPKCDARVDKHFEGYYTLQFCRRGKVELYYGDQRHLLNARVFWPAFPGPRIRFHAAPGKTSWAHDYIAFRGPQAVEWMADGLFPHAPQECPSGFEAEKTYARIYSWAFSPRTLDRMRAIHALEGMLLELAGHRTAVNEPAWMTRLMSALDSRDAVWPDYPQLARICGFSLPHLRRLFLKETGQTLHDYVIQTRMAQARGLLGGSELSIKEVADRLGYEDVFYFTKQFHAVVGMPPAAYRKSLA